MQKEGLELQRKVARETKSRHGEVEDGGPTIAGSSEPDSAISVARRAGHKLQSSTLDAICDRLTYSVDTAPSSVIAQELQNLAGKLEAHGKTTLGLSFRSV